MARAARELAQKRFSVLEAQDADTALALLAQEEVGALVCDLDGRSEDPAALLRVLKNQSPQTQLIVASGSSDSETIINLINEARIYRFVKKPVNYSLLDQALATALDRYARVMMTPGLVRVESAKKRKESAAERSFLERIKTLGGRFAAVFRS